ncbi:hypothetical protein P43SY_007732 [Pythium insidiosum]|uniref:Transient receptor potential Ca2 channel (TRP-CC) family protein n=1 Tax=Pythium insidiosum TaxID=114742 RepID=A0AAD5M5Y2_PYTIN|nr:hypothetical protein P43SY_007732 [Pythium insidiosum]
MGVQPRYTMTEPTTTAPSSLLSTASPSRKRRFMDVVLIAGDEELGQTASHRHDGQDDSAELARRVTFKRSKSSEHELEVLSIRTIDTSASSQASPLSIKSSPRGGDSPLSKTRPNMSASQTITLEMLRPHFEKPLAHVAQIFGICVTLLKKICRKNGLARWPHRQIIGLRKSIASMEQAIGHFEGARQESYAQQLQKQRKKLAALLEDPTKISLLGMDDDASPSGMDSVAAHPAQTPQPSLIPAAPHPAISHTHPSQQYGAMSPHDKQAANGNAATTSNQTTATSFLSAHGGARDDALDQCSIHVPMLGTPVPADANAHGAAARTGDASLTQPPMLERRTSEFMYPQKGVRSRRRGATAPDDASTDMGPLLLGVEPHVPRCFLSYPFYHNSFFARRLLRVSASLTVVMMLGVGVYYGYRPRSLVLNPDFPEDFGFMLRSPEEVYLLMASSCENMVGFSALVYHAFPAIIVLGLPGTGWRLFEPFKREPLVDAAGNKQKVKRTFLFQFCEAVGVWLLLFALLVMVYFWYMFFNGGTFKCLKIEVHVFAAGAVLCYITIFVVLSYFARYREHIKMQLGAFKESDQTGDVRKHLVDPATAELMTKRNKVISHIRKRLYQAARLGDIGELRDVLSFAQSRQNTLPGFPMKYYRDPSIFFGVFGHSRKNPLHVAAYHGNIEALELLVEAGFEVNALDKFSRVRFSTGDLFWYFAQFFISRPAVSDEENAVSVFKTTLVTPLHCAVATGQLEAVRWLLAHGAEVGSRAKSSYRSERIPPIFLAETPEVVRELLEHGANHLAIPDPGYMNTLTVLQLAYLRENHAVAHELEEWGCDVALTPIHAAAACNDTATVRKYIRRGTNVNCLGEHGYCGMNRRTPLHWAAVIGATETVDLLLEAGADPDFQDARGRTPLHWAARLNHLDIVRSLLAKNASPNVVDEDHMTPIICAAFAPRATRELFGEIVAAGGDINYQLPTNGDTALHVAVREENEEAALSILASGGNIMKMNIEGLRPLDCSTNTKLLFEIKRAAGHRDVMISYTHTHTEFAKKLRRSLEDANVTTWLDLMDPSGIGGGAVWREEIARGITNAALVVCILTEDYAQSEWCLKELALAKQVGTPILAVSTEGVRLGEELQVYLYTRQIIPFEPCITETTRNADNPRQIEYLYDDAKFRSQFRLLLDGVRDEIEKRRNAMITKNTSNNATTTEASIVANSVVGISKMFQLWDAPDAQFVFISHGDRNCNFVTRLYKELSARSIAYYGDHAE